MCFELSDIEEFHHAFNGMSGGFLSIVPRVYVQLAHDHSVQSSMIDGEQIFHVLAALKDVEFLCTRLQLQRLQAHVVVS